MGLESEIQKFLEDNFLFRIRGFKIDRDTSFLEHGVVNSIGMIEIVNFIEKTYGIKVTNEEMIPENLDSIHKLICFITYKRTIISSPPRRVNDNQ
jgi:acyl carrier protein